MPGEAIHGGSFLLARRLFQSAIWLKAPLYLKVWVWIIGRANYAECRKDGETYGRGELVTTYDEIIKAAAYYHNKKHIFPTVKQVRLILAWLEREGMIKVEPIRRLVADTIRLYSIQKSFSRS